MFYILLNVDDKPPAEYLRQIKSTPQELELLWTRSGVYHAYQPSGGQIGLVGDSKGVFLLGGFSPDQANSLVWLNPLTGEIIWQSLLGKRVNTLDSKGDLIYVGFSGQGRIGTDNTRGAGGVIAYDRATGIEQWTRYIPGAGGNINSIQTFTLTTDSFISVDAQTEYHYLLDGSTGDIVTRRLNGRTYQDEINGYILHIDDERVYERKGLSIRAVDRRSKVVAWSVDIPIDQPPIFIDDLVLIKTGAGLGLVYAIDRATGEMVWQYEGRGVVSNVTVDQNDNVYFLTQAARLIRADGQRGQVLGTVAFEPDEIRSLTNNAFFVAVSNDIIVTYFSDSRQLFAFRFSPDE